MGIEKFKSELFRRQVVEIVDVEGAVELELALECGHKVWTLVKRESLPVDGKMYCPRCVMEWHRAKKEELDAPNE